MWEGEGALHVNIPGRVKVLQKRCSSHPLQVLFANGHYAETCDTTFSVESDVKRMSFCISPCRTSYYKII